MSDAAIRILKSLHKDSDAENVIRLAKLDTVKLVGSNLESILSKYLNDAKVVSLIKEDFEEWFKSFLGGAI